jgi:hypothetical protein
MTNKIEHIHKLLLIGNETIFVCIHFEHTETKDFNYYINYINVGLVYFPLAVKYTTFFVGSFPRLDPFKS